MIIGMTITEAAEAWDNGQKSVVWRACVDNPEMLPALKNYLTPEDHQELTNRFQLHQRVTPAA